EAECRRHAVLLAHRAAPVGEQEERQLVLGGEFLVRRLAVGADPDHLGAGVLQVLVLVTEGTGFLGAPRRVVLRVEVEDDGLLAALVGQPYRATVPIRKGEIRRAIADGDNRMAATEKVEECHGRRDSTKAKGGQPRPWPPRPGRGLVAADRPGRNLALRLPSGRGAEDSLLGRPSRPVSMRVEPGG